MAEERNFFKYPRTKHIFAADSGTIPRDDLLMTPQEADSFLSPNQTVVIEEKVDGANLGFSIEEGTNKILVQNRAHYVNAMTHRQFSIIDQWIEKHSADLFTMLRPGRDILFGEWLYAKHSVHYTSLPNYFLAFDIYDTGEKCFFSRDNFNERLQETNISTVRVLAREANLNKERLFTLLDSPSQFCDGLVEGIVLRIDNNGQNEKFDGTVFVKRGKIVRSDFIQQIEESWTRQKFTKNVLSYY